MTRQTGSPGVDLPGLRAALLAHLASVPPAARIPALDAAIRNH